MGDERFPHEVVHTIVKGKGMSFRGMVAAFAVSLILLVPGALWIFGIRPPELAQAAPLPPSIAQIQGMTELATTKVHISDFIEGENEHYQGRWTLHGEVVLGVDLSGARYVKVDEKAKRASLHLPQPHIISHKVDHERSEEVYIKSKVYVAFARSSRQPFRDEVWKHADRKMEQLGQEIGYIERAKVQAERVLGQLFEGVGWKVDFEWD